ncbi:hypothetical protein GB937_004730 [Aspergillus fischeri]|nr:hypothetical protein GB937_004730 [Aspergillus fischeri]
MWIWSLTELRSKDVYTEVLVDVDRLYLFWQISCSFLPYRSMERSKACSDDSSAVGNLRDS